MFSKEDEKVKAIQQELLVALKAFHKICADHDINYSLHGGTLLGAIREHGFIPWDDDVDVSMTRNEFEKLLSVLNSITLPEYFRFCIVEKWVKLVLQREGRPCVFIDIFIYDGISRFKILQKLKCTMLMFISGMLKEKELIEATIKRNHYGKIKLVLYYIAYLVGKPFSNERKYKWYDCLSQKWLCGDGSYIHRSNDRYCGLVLILPRSWMLLYEIIPFEDTELMVSKNWQEILASGYGEDYMTPIRWGGAEISHQLMRKYESQNFIDGEKND